MQIFGEIGVLADDGEKVQCHICGKWYIKLGTHIIRGHEISYDDYRAAFGLARSMPLASKSYRMRINEICGANLVSGADGPGAAALKLIPRDQLSENGKKERRLSTLKKISLTSKLLGTGARLNVPEVKRKAIMKRQEAIVNNPELRVNHSLGAKKMWARRKKN